MIVDTTDPAKIKGLIKEHRAVIVDFSTDWCGPCKILAKDFIALEKKYGSELVIIEVDKDVVTGNKQVDGQVPEEKFVEILPFFADVVKQGGVPVLVFFKDGKLINKILDKGERFESMIFGAIPCLKKPANKCVSIEEIMDREISRFSDFTEMWSNRPAFWTSALLEWIAVLSITGWIADIISIDISYSMSSPANVSITSLEITSPRPAPGPYAAGTNFTLVITFTNTGGMAATVGATLAFGGYAGLSYRSPQAIVVEAHGQGTQEFTIVVDTDATNALATIAVGWNGSEAISGRSMSNDTTSTVDVRIEAAHADSIGNPLQLAIPTISFSFAAILAVIGIVVAKRGKKPRRDWIEV
nr:thioredoxin family protein [Candidatus Sigynarchaeum springense]